MFAREKPHPFEKQIGVGGARCFLNRGDWISPLTMREDRSVPETEERCVLHSSSLRACVCEGTVLIFCTHTLLVENCGKPAHEHRRLQHKNPTSMWLPECVYYGSVCVCVYSTCSMYMQISVQTCKCQHDLFQARAWYINSSIKVIFTWIIIEFIDIITVNKQGHDEEDF